MTAQTIMQDFNNYISQNGSNYRSWYVGITSDSTQRLFSDHNVSQNGGIWIYRTADNNMMARSVEKYFLDLGCNGGPGGGDNTSMVVYAYYKTNNTNENV